MAEVLTACFLFRQDLPEGNYLDLKKHGQKEKANTMREMKVAFRCAVCRV